MKLTSKRPAYYVCLVAALCNIIETVLFAVNIPAALATNISMFFLGLGALIFAAASKNSKAMYCGFGAMLLVILSTVPALFFGTLLAWAVLALPSIKHKKPLSAYFSMAVVAMALTLVVFSFFAMSKEVAIILAGLCGITNTIFCIVMIKNEESLQNDKN